MSSQILKYVLYMLKKRRNHCQKRSLGRWKKPTYKRNSLLRHCINNLLESRKLQNATFIMQFLNYCSEGVKVFGLGVLKCLETRFNRDVCRFYSDSFCHKNIIDHQIECQRCVNWLKSISVDRSVCMCVCVFNEKR